MSGFVGLEIFKVPRRMEQDWNAPRIIGKSRPLSFGRVHQSFLS